MAISLKIERLTHKEQGMFIIIVIVIVAVLANISLLGMSNTLYSTRLAAGFVQYSQAFQRAKLALTTSQNRLAGISKYAVSNNKPAISGAYPQFIAFKGTQVPAWHYIEQQKLWRDDRYSVLERNKNGLITSAYIIEKLLIVDAATSSGYFRITVKGWGSDAKTAVTLQSLVKSGVSVTRLTWQIIH
jgi:Tfp pilus assembly protein PilX